MRQTANKLDLGRIAQQHVAPWANSIATNDASASISEHLTTANCAVLHVAKSLPRIECLEIQSRKCLDERKLKAR